MKHSGKEGVSRHVDIILVVLMKLWTEVVSLLYVLHL